MNTEIFVCWTIDCEATQKLVQDPDLGERAVRGFTKLLSDAEFKVTCFVLPGDAEACAGCYKDLALQGYEVGLHVHPHEMGYDDYCGGFDEEEQRKIFTEAKERFTGALGSVPLSIRTGSCSANDSTFPLTEALGFTACSHSMPGRDMTNLRSNWVGSPLSVHRTNRANRLLEGDMNLVEVPVSTDPDTMMWSGHHAQDLRVELFDAKNQRYFIDKLLGREKERDRPVRAIVALTHNIFEYGNPDDFRYQTLRQMVADFSELADKHQVKLIPATIGEIAEAFRNAS